MSSIKLTIPMMILPKEIPRFRRYEKVQPGGRGGHFYPPSAKHEEEIGLLATGQMRKKGYKIIEGDVVLSANFYYKDKVPGDLDYILSSLLDGIKSVVVRDDRFIVGLERVFAIPNADMDCVVVEIREVKDLWGKLEKLDG